MQQQATRQHAEGRQHGPIRVSHSIATVADGLAQPVFHVASALVPDRSGQRPDRPGHLHPFMHRADPPRLLPPKQPKLNFVLRS